MYLHTLVFEEINVLKELHIVSSRETKLHITFIIQTSSITSLQNFLAGKIGVGTHACSTSGRDSMLCTVSHILY